MKQKHLKVGNMENFKKHLDKLGVLDGKYVARRSFSHLFGLPVIEVEGLPADKAFLVNKEGDIIETYKI